MNYKLKIKNLTLFMAVLAVALAFAACSKDEAINKGKDISFSAQRYDGGNLPEFRPDGTRAPATTTSDIDAFVVYGSDNVFAAKGELIFDNITVARKGNLGYTTPVFDYAPKRFFGEGANDAVFFAYSPVSAKMTSLDFAVPTSNLSQFVAGSTFDYTVATPYAYQGNTPWDLLWTEEYYKQEDLLVAATRVSNPNNSVHLEFKHALSRVFVAALNTTEDPVYIKEITLRNLNSTGTFNYNAFLSGSQSGIWTGAGNPESYSYVLPQVGAMVPPHTGWYDYIISAEQGMMILPQAIVNKKNDVDKGDVALEILYDFGGWFDLVSLTYLQNGFEFVAGGQYVINANFTGTAVGFQVSVQPFTPVPPTPINPVP